jgi:hypothetical protein
MKVHPRTAALVVFALSATLLFAQKAQRGEAAPAQRYTEIVTVAIISEDAESLAFAQALATALARELTAAGFRVSMHPAISKNPESEALYAHSLSETDAARWAALARCAVQDGRLVWRAAVYDALDGALIASDSQGAFPGLSALSLLDNSAQLVASGTAALKDRKVPGKHIDYRIRFSSPDEGALVTFGQGEGSREAGVVQDGGLTAPFAAFRAGDPVVVSVSKEGYWPKTLIYYLRDEDKVQKLPPLMRITNESFSLGLATSRLLGVTAEYRRYLLPDAVYLKAADSLWFQYDFMADSIPVVHDEVRLGAGVYLFRPRDARLRLAVGTGASGISTLILGGNISDRLYFDATLDAVWFSWEWHHNTWAIALDQRVSYSLGLDCGLLSRGWVEINHIPMIFTLGVVKKW